MGCQIVLASPRALQVSHGLPIYPCGVKIKRHFLWPNYPSCQLLFASQSLKLMRTSASLHRASGFSCTRSSGQKNYFCLSSIVFFFKFDHLNIKFLTWLQEKEEFQRSCNKVHRSLKNFFCFIPKSLQTWLEFDRT